MITIEKVIKDSLADKAGIKPQDRIISVNKNTVDDPVEFIFYTQGEVDIDLHLQKGTKKRNVRLHLSPESEIGIVPEPIKIKECTNGCLFCFVDQQPEGMREVLYQKDDDYRLSFLNGNFITLSNLRTADLNRIKSIGLSPLYVSVHTTDHELRRKMLGRKRIPDVIEQMETLIESGIKLHTQIVLVPGMNDGKVLFQTIEDLSKMRPDILSLGVVPVGLSKYRTGLLNLDPVTPEYATDLINVHYELRRNNPDLREFFYLSDEFFIQADYPIPPKPYYRDYPQIENGIGMVRQFLDQVTSHSISKNNRNKRMKVHLITGELFAPFLKKYLLPRLNRVSGEVHQIFNSFWGRSITVGNLLTYKDIADSLKSIPKGEPIVLPPRVVNEDWLFLDGQHIESLSEELKTDVYLAPEDPGKLMKFLENLPSLQRLRHNKDKAPNRERPRPPRKPPSKEVKPAKEEG